MKEKAEARWLSRGNYSDLFKEHPLDLITRFYLSDFSNFPLPLNTMSAPLRDTMELQPNYSNIVSILIKCDHIQAVRVDLTSTMLPPVLVLRR